MSYTDPHFAAPASDADCIQLLMIGGTECVKPAVDQLEASHPEWARTLGRAHRLLNEAGYILEELLGQPEGTFGAGGSGKGGGGGGGGG